MKSRLMAGAALVALMAGLIGVVAAPAALAAGIHYVSSATVGGDTSCADPGFNSIQAAVTASGPGDLINVCAGTYTEQVTIQTNLTLLGAGAGTTTIQMPASPADSTCNPSPVGVHTVDVVDVCGGAVATIAGVAVSGPYASNDCTFQGYGIAVVDGSAASISNATVTDIRQDPLNGCQGGVGILVGRKSTGQVGTAAISHVTVTGYQKNGVVVSNDGSSAQISSSTITGAGPTPLIAQNGVQFSDGGAGKLTTSDIGGNECDHAVCGPDPLNDTQSAGVLLIDAGPKTKIQKSTIHDNDMGVYNWESAAGNKATISKNTVTDNRYAGVMLDEGKATVSGNTITGGNLGIDVLAASWQDQGAKAKGTITKNTVGGTSVGAVVVSSDDPGHNPSLTLTGNKLLSNNLAGVVNPTTAIIKAAKNWWGDASGPGGWSIGSGSSVSDNVDFFPWYTDVGLSALKTCTASGTYIVDSAASPGSVLCGTTGADLIVEDGVGPVLILGNGGKDYLSGSNDDDAIIGGKKNDTIDGRGGTDWVQCRGGNDTVSNAEHMSGCP